MLWREFQDPKGGVLADDMGLGKTISIISLVLVAKYTKSETQDEKESSSQESENDVQRKKKIKIHHGNYLSKLSSFFAINRFFYLLLKGGTLIVCPATLIDQWENEVYDRVLDDKLSVFKYHNRTVNNPRVLTNSDLVITTYKTVSNEHKSKVC